MVGSIPSNGFNVVREIERRGRRVQEKIVVETMPKKCTHFVPAVRLEIKQCQPKFRSEHKH